MLDEHLGYLSDSLRLGLYASAISRLMKPDQTVLDLGCGSGVLGLLCLNAGARRVFAIDDTRMIEVARQTMERAGLADRTVFIHGNSHLVELPEKVDLVVCDHVGYFGFDYGIVHTLQDARQRFLRGGGALVPACIKISLCSVASTKCREVVDSWRAEKIPPAFHWLRQESINKYHGVHLTEDELLSEPAALAHIDLVQDNPQFFSWSADLRMSRDDTMQGLAGWFDCELTHGIWMTNSPFSDEAIDRPQAFLPIDEPVEVRSGELVKATIMTRPADGIVAWTVDFPASKRRFSHSTLKGMLLGQRDLAQADSSRVPHLSRFGRAKLAVLRNCDGKRTAEEVEQAVIRDYLDLFPSRRELSRFVAQVLGKDTEPW